MSERTEILRDSTEEQFQQLIERNNFEGLQALFKKTIQRRTNDPSGAITASKALVESSCKTVLTDLGCEIDKLADLPKLYRQAADALGLASKTQANETLKRAFSAFYTFNQSLCEFRNNYGDAHGSAPKDDTAPIALDEFAGNLAIGFSYFLLRNLEHQRILDQMTNEDGRPILKFEKTGLWRQLDHVRNATEHAQFYGENVGPSLMLVGDSGIYIMSNGKPPMNSQGIRLRPEEELKKGERLLVAYAIGCNPARDAFDYWWDIRSLFDEGSDFSIPLGIDSFESALNDCDSIVFVSIHDEYFEVFPDVEKPEWC